jgi:5-formyltetrahydrofolate cyclo-ligase
MVTTVHPLQVLEEELPETDHDFRIDFIVTPHKVIPIDRQKGRPKGIIRDHLTEEKIFEIPILREILLNSPLA